MPLYEISSALISSSVVTPAMTIIDTAVIRSQILNKPFFDTMKNSIIEYKNGNIPFRYPFTVMFGVYSSTYAAANLTEYLCKSNDINYKIPTIVMTSIVNISAIAYKDKEYAKLFTPCNKTHFPKLSFALFAIRDTITISSSFVLKKDVINYMEKSGGIEHNKADFLASLFVPALAQTISTPIHILSLDLYCSPKDSLQKRITNIIHKYPSVCLGRMLRVIPAFGIGGFINDMLRQFRYN